MHVYIYVISKSRSIIFNVVTFLLNHIIGHITPFLLICERSNIVKHYSQFRPLILNYGLVGFTLT